MCASKLTACAAAMHACGWYQGTLEENVSKPFFCKPSRHTARSGWLSTQRVAPSSNSTHSLRKHPTSYSRTTENHTNH
jgi:hypothetical protein